MRPHKPNVTQETVAIWAADLRAGMTPEQIAVKHGYHENTIKVWLKGAGIWEPDHAKNPHKPKPLNAGDAFAVAIGTARYQDEPAEVWKSRTQQPVFVPPGHVANQTLGGVAGALA